MELRLNKVIPVEEENLEQAIEKAEEIFYDNELTAEYLDARNIRFFENHSVVRMANGVSKLIIRELGTEFSKEILEEHFNKKFDYLDDKELVFNEVLKILEEDYNISFEKISI